MNGGRRKVLLTALLGCAQAGCVYSFEGGGDTAIGSGLYHDRAAYRYDGGYYVSRPGVPVLIWVGGVCPAHLEYCRVYHGLPPRSPAPDDGGGSGETGDPETETPPPMRPRIEPNEDHVPAGRPWRDRPSMSAPARANPPAGPSAAGRAIGSVIPGPARTPSTAVRGSRQPLPGPGPGARPPAAEHPQ